MSPFALSQIETAKITGGRLKGVVNDGVASFKGIPFATPPVGDLRWKVPQPVKAWNGVKVADTFARGCMQDASMSAIIGVPANFGEDCLNLNIWTAAKTAREKLPLMVWIHRGAFVGGMTGTPMFLKSAKIAGLCPLPSPGGVVQAFCFRTFTAFRFPVGHTASQAPQPLHFEGSTPGKDS